jgi:hypothetical protein
MTVRRSRAPLYRQDPLAAALRSGREALTDIEGQLDALLTALRDPGRTLEGGAADRLSGATRDAGSAIAALGALARRR